MIYDPEPSVRYRQHGGEPDRRQPRARGRGSARLRMLAGGRLAEYSDINLAALERAAPLLTPEARAKVALLRRAAGCRSGSGSAASAGSASTARPAAAPLTLWLAFVAGRL